MDNITRRQFIKGSAIAGGGVLATSNLAASNLLGGFGAKAEAAPALADEPVAQQSRMKITAVTPYLCNSRWLMIKVETDSGLVGWGECGAHGQQPATVEVVNQIAKAVVGLDPFKIEWIWNGLARNGGWRGAVYMSAVSALDCALWDIKGKYFGVPIYELLGGANRDKIRAYETCSGSTPEEVANNVKKLHDAGWKYIRIRLLHGAKVGKGCPDGSAEKIYRNVEVMKAVRETVGYDVDISLEAHRGLKPSEAIELGKRLDPYLIHFYEDPVVDIPSVVKYVADNCAIPIGTGERYINMYEFAWIINNTNVRFLRPDMCLCGGITAGRKIAAMAEANGVYIIPHNPLGPISTAAALQLDAYMPNFEVQEWPDDGTGVIKEPFQVENGYVKLLTKPGLGIELVDDFFEKYPWKGRTSSISSLHEDGSFVDR